jgi:simple sugar transport system ATP-binding protein
VELPAGEFGTRPLLSLRGVSLPAGEESPGLRGIDLDLYPGEIFGIAAVSGNGERDLAGAIADPSRIAAGSIEFDGERVEGCTALEMFARGLAYTPEDRIREAVLPDGSISENVLLGHQGEERFLRKRLFIDWRKVRETAKELIERYHVQAPGPDVPMRTLSGGNMQKAVMGRAFVNPIKLLLTHNPTSGLDISTVEFIFAKLVELSRTRGGTVLWINEDLDELMIISDRIGVLSGGRLTRVRGRSEFDKYAIGREMIGGGEQV